MYLVVLSPKAILALGLLLEVVMSDDYGVGTVSSMQSIQCILKKSNGMCAICGKPINLNDARGTSWNVDHVIPRAIAKWALDLTKEELEYLKVALASEENLVITHYQCNIQKSTDFSEEYINALNLSTSAQADLHKLVEQLRPFIEKYFETVDTIKRNAQYKCEMCGAPITYDFVIRRVDNRFPRSLQNAWLACKVCGNKVRNHKKRINFPHVYF